MKKILLFVFLSLFITVSAVCAGDLDAAAKAGTLYLGVSADRAPFVFYDRDDELTGIDIKLMEEIAERMGLELDVSEMSSDDLIESLTVGQVDIVGGAFSKLASRQSSVDYTNIYYIAEGVFMARTDTQLTGPLDDGSFRGKKIGVIKNSGFEFWLKSDMYDRGNVLKKDIYTYDKTADEIRALERGKIDLALMDLSVYQLFYQNDPAFRIFEYEDLQDDYAFGVRKGSDLKAEINKQMSAMMKDGTAQKIADVFYNMDYSESPSVIRFPASRDSVTPTSAAGMLPTAPISFPSAMTAYPVVYTPVPTVMPTAAPVAVNCSNSSAFMADITIPDGQEVSAGTGFTKTWRIRNVGTCPWSQDFYLGFVSGERMDGTNGYLPKSVYPGESVDVSVALTAPAASGNHRGYWQMKTPQGSGFGTAIYVEITVPDVYGYPASDIYYPPTATPAFSESWGRLSTPVFHIEFTSTAKPVYALPTPNKQTAFPFMIQATPAPLKEFLQRR